MVDAAIFDMDGLMFDTQHIYDEMWGSACKKLGIPLVPGLVEDTRGTIGKNMYAVIRRYYGSAVDPSKLWDENKRLTYASLEKSVPKQPGLDDLLTWLGCHHVPMAVASSSERDIVRHNICTAGVERFFSDVVTGDMVKRSKPDPDIFLLAAQRLGTDPSRTLVLEDSPNGVRAGHAGGFITVMVPNVARPTTELLKLADGCCRSLFEVRDLLEEGQI
ncbi:MAG: HAD family phosphatase [Atopobiaceae bacterium]|jgi:HAD superfamily hydrolase (TIGR01509 family)|nr:HAD family phosphatase [Atopobiaceae bacterium]